MKRLICQEPGRMEMAEVDLPLVGEAEALIRIVRIGVCGTDYHAFRGKQPFFAYPRVLGHEIAAEVVAVGDHVSDFRAGDRVTVLPYLECGVCTACRRGKTNACRHLRVFGVHLDGGMQEVMSVPISHLVKTDQLTFAETAVIEPLAIGLHAVRRAQIKEDDDVLVIGGGPIGLATMRYAKLAGGRVIAMDLSEDRLMFCRDWAGADELLRPSEDTLRSLQAITQGELAATVIDATGNAASMMDAFGYAAQGGSIVYVSLVQGDIHFADPEFHKKELTLMGSRAATRAEFHLVMDSLHSGGVDGESYVTHQASFGKAVQAFHAWLEPSSKVIKAQLVFD
ncbi:zinc-binding alcohol dehydrogenase family protein [Paenibacillus sp. CC-CFT747]|nr:zinc-binding alcohol dehydrogenase family protein [Paenibacillus sp. CC-CFT747]